MIPRTIEYWDDGRRAGLLYLAGRSRAHLIDLGTLRHVTITLREAGTARTLTNRRNGARLAAWIERKARLYKKFPMSLNAAAIERACSELRKPPAV